MRRLRILHTEASMELGGQEYATLALLEGLRDRGHVVILVVRAGSLLQISANERGIPCQTIMMGKFSYPWSVSQLWAIIREKQVDVIHTHGSPDNWIGALAARFSWSRPVVVLTRHKSTPIGKHALNRVLYHQLVDRIVSTGGESMRRQWIVEYGFPENHVVAIPTGADVERFFPHVEGIAFRKELGVGPNDCLIGSVCFLRSYKGLDYFIEAAAIIAKQSSQCRFVIVGDGPEKERVQKKISALQLCDRFVLVGHREDVPNIMAALDVLVVSSIEGEALPQAIPQALATETPVVATEVGSISDIIQHGETGLLVPPRNSQELASQIFTFVENPAIGRAMAQKGRRRVEESFSSQIAVEKNEGLYYQLLSEKSITCSHV